MAISPQRLTIYLYSAHRAVIFAIAQLSCCSMWHRRVYCVTLTGRQFQFIWRACSLSSIRDNLRALSDCILETFTRCISLSHTPSRVCCVTQLENVQKLTVYCFARNVTWRPSRCVVWL